MKEERLQNAIARIVRRELGPAVPIDGWISSGVYEHFYDDNFAEVADVGTHYIVLPHRCVLDQNVPLKGDDQHEALRWFALDELMSCDDVHAYTKAYFAGAG
jgi:colanic acid biosynthesis protein WcaH